MKFKTLMTHSLPRSFAKLSHANHKKTKDAEEVESRPGCGRGGGGGGGGGGDSVWNFAADSKNLFVDLVSSDGERKDKRGWKYFILQSFIHYIIHSFNC